MEHLIKFCMKHIHSKLYVVIQLTPWHLTLGGTERSNQCHWVFIGLYIIDHVLLDSGAVRSRCLLLLSPFRFIYHLLPSVLTSPHPLTFPFPILYISSLSKHVPSMHHCQIIFPISFWACVLKSFLCVCRFPLLSLELYDGNVFNCHWSLCLPSYWREPLQHESG